jgi:elongation factor Ts
MANYTAADIKALRERTGAGMLDVKEALVEAEGNQDKAVEILRVKGLKGVAKREGRDASDGIVVIDIRSAGAGEIGVLVEVNSETDFVAKNATFIALAETVLAHAATSGAADAAALLATKVGGGTVQGIVDAASATLGERLVVRRLARVSGEKVTSYLHKVNKDLPPQVGVLVASDAAGAQVAKDIAMHIAAYSPTYLTRDDVPIATVESERRIAEETARTERKPEASLPRIIEGRLGGFFKENVLLDQGFAKDPKKTVAQVLAEVGGSVTGFARFRVGV